MAQFIVLAAMKGQFVSAGGNMYDNFQMLGYVEAGDPAQAVTAFFDQTPYPNSMGRRGLPVGRAANGGGHTGHHGDYDRVYVESLRRRWDPPESTTAKD